MNFAWSFVEGYQESYLKAFPKDAVQVDLPHAAKILPLHYFDEKAYQGLFTYEKIFDLPEPKKPVHILAFDGAMNGYETSIIFDTVKKDTASPYVITLNTDKVFYGTLEASADLKKIFYDLINESFANSDWISFDNVATSSNYGAITVNFEKAITESPNFAALSAALTLQNKHLQVSLLGQDISSSGVINVNAVSQ